LKLAVLAARLRATGEQVDISVEVVLAEVLSRLGRTQLSCATVRSLRPTRRNLS
jgi:hypothetical protein